MHEILPQVCQLPFLPTNERGTIAANGGRRWGFSFLVRDWGSFPQWLRESGWREEKGDGFGENFRIYRMQYRVG